MYGDYGFYYIKRHDLGITIEELLPNQDKTNTYSLTKAKQLSC